MPVQIDIETFLNLSKKFPVLDVRSPAEYLHAHIPGAISLPLFSDEQRKVIGTAYKRESRQIAVNIGLNYFSERMKKIPGEVAAILDSARDKSQNVDFPNSDKNQMPCLLVHCWRGGMRSGAVAWLLSLFGYKIYVLKGGYKSCRNWALHQFKKPYSFKILGGFTGSGKTALLKEMRQNGKSVIDLEQLANHKGSAFGALGEMPQPSQEMFENLLAVELWRNSGNADRYNGNGQTKIDPLEIWLEDESRNIGTVNIPNALWEQMRCSQLYFLDIPFEERLNHIVNTYGNFAKEDLTASIMQLQKRLGGADTKNAIGFLASGKPKDSFSILMRYYDKVYLKSLHSRENIQSVLNKIPCKSVDIKNAAQLTG